MTADEMRAVVARELEATPRGTTGSAINAYRMAYEAARLNSLGRRAQIPNSPEAAREVAVRAIRIAFPMFGDSDLRP